jgi:hypothetical protein
MNERIRELVRESHIDVYGLGKDRDQWEAALDRYTELIVWECAMVASTETSDDGVGEVIKEHFGIKE